MRHLRVLPPAPANDTNAACDSPLDAIEVQTPCEIPWDSMQGDNRVRFCDHCRQNVYNIEALARAEAVRLIGDREGRVCVRFHRRRDGTVVTAGCWERLRAARRNGLLAFAAMLVIVGAAQLFAMFTGLAGLHRLVRQGEVPVGAIRTMDSPAPPPPPAGPHSPRGDVTRLPASAPPAHAPENPHRLMGKMRVR